MRTCIVSIIMLFVFCLGVLPKAQAQNDATPVGLWNMILYLEPDLHKNPFTIGICFASNGTWFFTSPIFGNGDWFQKGDRMRFYGRTGSPTLPGGFAAFGQFSSNLQFAGEFANFRVSVSSPPVFGHLTVDIGNFIIFKASNTCP